MGLPRCRVGDTDTYNLHELHDLEGYRIERVVSGGGTGLACGDGHRRSSLPATLLAAKQEKRYALKVVPDEGRTAVQRAAVLRSVQHTSVDPVVDVLQDDDALVVVRRWHDDADGDGGDNDASSSPRLSADAASRATLSLLSASKYLGDVLGGSVALNVHSNNLRVSDDGTVTMLDWFLPYLRPSAGCYSRRNDRLGLSLFLQTALRAPPPQCWIDDGAGGSSGAAAVSSPPPPSETPSTSSTDAAATTAEGCAEDAYQAFQEALRNTDEDVSNHRWVVTHRARPTLVSSTAVRPPVPPLGFVATRAEAALLLQQRMLEHTLKGVFTDKYLASRTLARIHEVAMRCLADAPDAPLPPQAFEALLAEATGAFAEGGSGADCSSNGTKQAAPNSQKPPGLPPPPPPAPSVPLPLDCVPALASGPAVHCEAAWFCEPAWQNQDALSVVPCLASYVGLVPQQAGGSGSDYAVGVFDGHAGVEAAEWCRHQLLPTLRLSPHYGCDMRRAVESVFHDVHDRFVRRAAALRVDAGTTATVAVVRDGMLHIGAAGDSTAVLSRAGVAIPLTHDHRPDCEAERKQVIARGGCFVEIMGISRVEGRLAVTRSIGDAPLADKITCHPDYSATQLQAEDEFFIVASDGLWDVVGHQEAVQFVAQCRAEIDSLDASSAAPSPSLDLFRRSSAASMLQTPTAGYLAPGSAPGTPLMPLGKRSSVLSRSILNSSTGPDDENRPPFPAAAKGRPPAHPAASAPAAATPDAAAAAAAAVTTDGPAAAATAAAADAAAPTCDERFDDYQLVAEALAMEARERGSQDDCTVCIVFLTK